MCFWLWVCTGMGTGMGLPYLGNTVPFSTVLQVCAGLLVPGFGQVSDHLTLLITSNFKLQDNPTTTSTPTTTVSNCLQGGNGERG
jgi:hypothetical protein